MVAKIVIFELYREVIYSSNAGVWTYMEKLGQHFLVNKEKIRMIIDALEAREGDTIIEIGPGHGELTLPFAAAENFQFPISNFQIIAIEKDKILAKNLEYRIQKLGIKNIEIVTGDALKILPSLSKFQIPDSKFKIIGNIPYYITGHLLRIIGELEHKPSLTVLTIQKEVTERIVAQPPHNNLLAASVQFWAKPEIIGYISRNDFMPKPRIDSAIVKLVTRNRQPVTGAGYSLLVTGYYRLIKILFKQPRKTILNNLRSSQNLRLGKMENINDVLKKLCINPNGRAQNLSVKDIIGLAKMFFGA